eukprot:CAMPEP_0117514072 /NCGR_PEP_ID=MMETSP0784-20121206/29882_1 /TAXON_ID=39447 /ORGANISM="" /LENGTH=313 /DNA_ID=CAMNT_0005309859 /DNA_START=41 /DNA_END=982 /DNA_ORIENTATION=+
MAVVEEPIAINNESEEEDDEDLVPPEGFCERVSAKSRGSVSAEAYGEWNKTIAFDLPVIPKTEEQTERLTVCLNDCFLFSCLEPSSMAAVIGAMEELHISRLQRVITQGEQGECLYVVEKGSFSCLITVSDGSEKVVKKCAPGDVFGELALLYNCPRAASVQSCEDSVVWKLDRETFNHIVKDAAQQKRTRHLDFLVKVPILASMQPYERSQLADALRTEYYDDGQVILMQGEIGTKFYIVEEGEAVATKNGEQVMSYVSGDYFGELALIREQPRATTVTSKGYVKVVSVEHASFKRLLDVEKLVEWSAKYNS